MDSISLFLKIHNSEIFFVRHFYFRPPFLTVEVPKLFLESLSTYTHPDTPLDGKFLYHLLTPVYAASIHPYKRRSVSSPTGARR